MADSNITFHEGVSTPSGTESSYGWHEDSDSGEHFGDGDGDSPVDGKPNPIAFGSS